MLAAGTEREVVIGRRLAAKLKLELGEKMVVMAQAARGELGTAAYRVTGIYATESSSFDGAFAFVTLPAAQSLLGLDSRVSTINVRLDDRARTGPITEELRARFGPRGLSQAPAGALPQLDEM